VTLVRAKESFSSLSLEGSDLHAEPPLLGSREVTKTFTRELWQLRWRPNDALDLYVILPPGVKNPPVVLYLYGYPSETDRFRDDRYCQRLVQNGAAAIGFVSALTGYRTQYRPPRQWFVSELPESLATTVHDVQMILNYLDTRGDLDMSRVGMFGQGSGGAIAILSAAVDPRLKVLDLLDPWGDWPDYLAKVPMLPDQERAEYVKADFLKRLEPLEPLRFLPELQSRSIRIQFVDQNGEPKEVVSKLNAAAPSTAKIIQYHDGLQFRGAVAGGGLFVWIANELKSQKETKTVSKDITAQKKRVQ
jgi:acetyl esterase/lipase